jgi:hypothetical protein
VVIKLVHLGALVFWLGPPLGAWLVLRTVEDGSYQQGSLAEKVSRVFYLTVILEHVAFIALLATGFLMALKYDLMESVWLNQKIFIVFLVVVPLEVADVLLGNWIASTASKKLYAGEPLKNWERYGLEAYHGIFTKIALIVIPLSVLAIMYLATSKAGFGALS